MAGLEGFEKLPVWQRVALLVFVTAAIGVGWYFLFYEDALEEHAAAQGALAKADLELAAAKQKKANYLEEKRKHAEAEAELQRKMEVLPMNSSTVDNLMQVFQQKARLVGMTVESWTNEPETREEYHARLPIKIRATGTWPQVGEFFRQVSELKQIVSVDRLSLNKKSGKSDERGASPLLSVEFEASTYRFISDEERQASPQRGQRRDRRNR